MTNRVQVGDISVAPELYAFINDEVLPGTDLAQDQFWSAMDSIIHTFGARNRELLSIREQLQQQIDSWHQARRGQAHDQVAYESFLSQIGYLKPEGADFQVTTDNVDIEIASVAGPQLVVPVSNARYAINAANARWGSLYDAYYGTDALGDLPSGAGYDPDRGQRVISAGRSFLDKHVPLDGQSYSELASLSCEDGRLVATLGDGSRVGLNDPTQFAGYTGNADAPESLLLRNNGLHIEIKIDWSHTIGSTDTAGIADIVLEAALSTICDLEDSIAAVDAADKVAAYRNWLGLMKGDIVEEFEKAGQTIRRALNSDRTFSTADNSTLTLHGRSLLLVRNVGHLMESDAVLDRNGRPAMEGLVGRIDFVHHRSA